MTHISDTLEQLREELQSARDSEVSMLAEVLPQYVQDHNNKAAYRDIDQQVNALARAIDRMIAKLGKWQAEAEKIEQSVENFYGD